MNAPNTSITRWVHPAEFRKPTCPPVPSFAITRFGTVCPGTKLRSMPTAAAVVADTRSGARPSPPPGQPPSNCPTSASAIEAAWSAASEVAEASAPVKNPKRSITRCVHPAELYRFQLRLIEYARVAAKLLVNSQYLPQYREPRIDM